MERADESVSDENNRAAGKCRPRDASARGVCSKWCSKQLRHEEEQRRRTGKTAEIEGNAAYQGRKV